MQTNTKTLGEAEKAARKVYTEVIEAAWETYLEEEVAARTKYEAAWVVYQEAKQSARKVYDEAIEAAGKG